MGARWSWPRRGVRVVNNPKWSSIAGKCKAVGCQDTQPGKDDFRPPTPTHPPPPTTELLSLKNRDRKRKQKDANDVRDKIESKHKQGARENSPLEKLRRFSAKSAIYFLMARSEVESHGKLQRTWVELKVSFSPESSVTCPLTPAKSPALPAYLTPHLLLLWPCLWHLHCMPLCLLYCLLCLFPCLLSTISFSDSFPGPPSLPPSLYLLLCLSRLLSISCCR